MSDDLTHYGVKGMKWGVRRAAKRDVKDLRKAEKSTGSRAEKKREKIVQRIVDNDKGRKGYEAEFSKAYAKAEAREGSGRRYATNALKGAAGAVAVASLAAVIADPTGVAKTTGKAASLAGRNFVKVNTGLMNTSISALSKVRLTYS